MKFVHYIAWTFDQIFCKMANTVWTISVVEVEYVDLFYEFKQNWISKISYYFNYYDVRI